MKAFNTPVTLSTVKNEASGAAGNRQKLDRHLHHSFATTRGDETAVSPEVRRPCRAAAIRQDDRRQSLTCWVIADRAAFWADRSA